MQNLSILSFNVRGLRDPQKRKEMFMWLRKKEHSIFLLQQVHGTEDIEKLWYAEWGYTVIFSHGTNDARGVSILFKNNFDHKIHGIIKDESGRYIILDITIQEKRITLANIYGSNTDSPEIYSKFIEQIENIDNDNRIIGGDHNFVLNVYKDKKRGKSGN